MVRKYKRKSERQSWSEEDLKSSIKALLKGEKLSKISESFKIPRITLKRNFKRYQQHDKENTFIYKRSK